MTRFKKELLKRGVRLEETEMCLPSADGLQGTHVDTEEAKVTYYFDSIVGSLWFDRSFNVTPFKQAIEAIGKHRLETQDCMQRRLDIENAIKFNYENIFGQKLDKVVFINDDIIVVKTPDGKERVFDISDIL